MKSIRSCLVANRGEIALRIMRTAAKLGIETVGLYSEADRHAPHARFADRAFYIGASPPSCSYLDIEKVIEVAKRAGVDAVHPGYGFLAENAEFARACAQAGLVFVGPRPETIRTMGSKIASRRAVARAEVPLIPGFEREGASDEELEAAARELGFPVLVKASAGGGGRGMRLVAAPDALGAAIRSARREAKAAFGDDTLYLEKVIEGARHIEVQIFGDAHGNVVHLFERECSVQRRHQKVIEEAPAPGLSEALRNEIHAAAVRAARAVEYVGAGTVEMLLEPSGRFYFLEMNTRLQVEHPVTEAITGLDLVELQFLVARGRPLPFVQSELERRGHAIECRLYAEDPENDFFPETGRLALVRLPEGCGVRVDAGLEDGYEVGVHYDPMLAKVIGYGEERAEALCRLRRALARTIVFGVHTNRAWLARMLEHPALVEGTVDTAFCERFAAELTEPEAVRQRRERRAALVAAVALSIERREAFNELGALLASWRNNRAFDAWVDFKSRSGERLRVLYRQAADDRFLAQISGVEELGLVAEDEASAIVLLERERSGDALRLRLEIEGGSAWWTVLRQGDAVWVHGEGAESMFECLPRLERKGAEHGEQGGLSAPMPGKVLRVLVDPEQTVAAASPLVVLESMKMETTISAPYDGVVRAVRVEVGDQVEAGALLVDLEPVREAVEAKTRGAQGAAGATENPR